MFSINPAYNFSTEYVEGLDNNLWKVIWGLKVPNRMRMFLWLVIHEKLMCNVERMKRGFAMVAECNVCPVVLEDVEHILRHCSEASQVWQRLLSSHELLKQQHLSFHDWFRHNIGRKVSCEIKLDWQVIFIFTLWWLWRWRNERIFNDVVKTIEYKVAWIKCQAEEIIQVFSKISIGVQGAAYSVQYIQWICPNEVCIKLNADESLKNERAGGGSILRDANGNWIVGFSINIGNCPIEEAEV